MLTTATKSSMGFNLGTMSPKGPKFSPLNLDGLEFWMQRDAWVESGTTSGKVETITDKSGNSRNVELDCNTGAD